MSNSHPHEQPELSAALASDICTAFDLGEPLSSQRITSGLMHSNYFLDTETGSYVARLLGYVDVDILGNERHIQMQLRQKGVPATYTLATNSGDFFYTTYDNKNVTVAEKLEGVHPGRPANDEDCLAAGQVLGNFHRAVDNITYSNERFALLGRDSTAYRITKLAERGSSVASDINQLYVQNVDRAFDSGLPSGVLHGDFHSENVLIEKGSGAVLDLETAFRGPFVLDIGRSLLDFCHRPDGMGMDQQKINRFLEGYNRVRPLANLEEDVIPSTIAFSCAAVASWLYLKKHNDIGELFLGIGTSIKTGGNEKISRPNRRVH